LVETPRALTSRSRVAANVVADIYCNATLCSPACDSALCGIRPPCARTASSVDGAAFQATCKRPLSCAATTSGAAPLPTTTTTSTKSTTPTPCDTTLCVDSHIRCLLIAQKEAADALTSAVCTCDGQLASCLPAKCGGDAARATCIGNVACTTAQCNASIAFVVATTSGVATATAVATTTTTAVRTGTTASGAATLSTTTLPRTSGSGSATPAATATSSRSADANATTATPTSEAMTRRYCADSNSTLVPVAICARVCGKQELVRACRFAFSHTGRA
jgi:hypothetical protein